MFLSIPTFLFHTPTHLLIYLELTQMPYILNSFKYLANTAIYFKQNPIKKYTVSVLDLMSIA